LGCKTHQNTLWDLQAKKQQQVHVLRLQLATTAFGAIRLGVPWSILCSCTIDGMSAAAA
jgi:hypothetical protein